MAEPTVDVLAVYDAAIFQRRRKLHLLTDKGAPQRAIDRQRDWLAKAEAARAAVAELIEFKRLALQEFEYLAHRNDLSAQDRSRWAALTRVGGAK